MARHSTARHSTARHGTARHGTAWHGMAWHGMAWHGMAWHGTGRMRPTAGAGHKGTAMPVIFKNIAILLLTTVLASCMAVGPAFERRPLASFDEGYLYVFRPGSTTAGGVGLVPDVHIDGTNVASLRDGGYVVARVSTGPHTVELRVPGASRSVHRTVDVPGMREVFLRVTIDTVSVNWPSSYTVGFEMLRVTPLQALDEIEVTRRVAEVSSFDGTVVIKRPGN
jgi:hypothetical protein